MPGVTRGEDGRRGQGQLWAPVRQPVAPMPLQPAAAAPAPRAASGDRPASTAPVSTGVSTGLQRTTGPAGFFLVPVLRGGHQEPFRLSAGQNGYQSPVVALEAAVPVEVTNVGGRHGTGVRNPPTLKAAPAAGGHCGQGEPLYVQAEVRLVGQGNPDRAVFLIGYLPAGAVALAPVFERNAAVGRPVQLTPRSPRTWPLGWR